TDGRQNHGHGERVGDHPHGARRPASAPDAPRRGRHSLRRDLHRAVEGVVMSADRSARGTGSGRTGVALSTTELVAVDARLRGSATREFRVSLEPPGDNGGGWPSLTTALGELARAIGVSEGTLSISLLPPLTEVRRVDLPPLSEDEAERLL